MGGPGTTSGRNGGRDIYSTEFTDAAFTLVPTARQLAAYRRGDRSPSGDYADMQLRTQGSTDRNHRIVNYKGSVDFTAMGDGIDNAAVVIPGTCTACRAASRPGTTFTTFAYTESPTSAAVRGSVDTGNVEKVIIQAADGAGTTAQPLVFNLTENWFAPASP